MEITILRLNLFIYIFTARDKKFECWADTQWKVTPREASQTKLKSTQNVLELSS